MNRFDEENHKYYIGDIEVPGVTTILRNVGLADDFTSVNDELLERSRQFGMAGHKTIELYNNGTLDYASLSPELLPILEHYKQFCIDFKFKAVRSEFQVYSTVWKYAGTIDIFGYIDGNIPTLVDLKTTSVISKYVGYQISGYKIGYEELFGEKIKRKICLQLTKTKYKAVEYKSGKDEQVFMSAVVINNAKGGK